MPSARALVVKVALAAALSVPVPSVVLLSRKVTAPVGVPAPGLFAWSAARLLAQRAAQKHDPADWVDDPFFLTN